MTVPTVVPARADGTDDAQVRARAAAIAHRHTEAIRESVQELAELQLVRSATVEVRAYPTATLTKLYIVNGEEVFFGFYPLIKHSVKVGGTSVGIRDVMGKDSTLFHFTIEDDDLAVGTPFVEQARIWFDSVWTVVSREYSP